MPYDENLAGRIRAILQGTPGLQEKKMFGGLAFLVNGHIAASAYRDGRLMITCAADDTAAFLAEPGAAPMVRGGRPMQGWVLIEAAAVADDAALARWVGRGLAHSAAQPAEN